MPYLVPLLKDEFGESELLSCWCPCLHRSEWWVPLKNPSQGLPQGVTALTRQVGASQMPSGAHGVAVILPSLCLRHLPQSYTLRPFICSGLEGLKSGSYLEGKDRNHTFMPGFSYLSSGSLITQTLPVRRKVRFQSFFSMFSPVEADLPHRKEGWWERGEN